MQMRICDDKTTPFRKSGNESQICWEKKAITNFEIKYEKRKTKKINKQINPNKKPANIKNKHNIEGKRVEKQQKNM